MEISQHPAAAARWCFFTYRGLEEPPELEGKDKQAVVITQLPSTWQIINATT